MADANKPDDSKTYKAIIASGVLRRACLTANCTTPVENTDWVLTPNTTYVRSTNTIIGTTNDAAILYLSINTLLNSFASGTAVNFWTGVIADWRSYVGHCNNWTDGTNGATSSAGVSNAIDNTAITAVPLNCDVMNIHLLCAEQ